MLRHSSSTADRTGQEEEAARLLCSFRRLIATGCLVREAVNYPISDRRASIAVFGVLFIIDPPPARRSAFGTEGRRCTPEKSASFLSFVLGVVDKPRA